jgi:hypothetical protein
LQKNNQEMVTSAGAAREASLDDPLARFLGIETSLSFVFVYERPLLSPTNVVIVVKVHQVVNVD